MTSGLRCAGQACGVGASRRRLRARRLRIARATHHGYAPRGVEGSRAQGKRRASSVGAFGRFLATRKGGERPSGLRGAGGCPGAHLNVFHVKQRPAEPGGPAEVSRGPSGGEVWSGAVRGGSSWCPQRGAPRARCPQRGAPRRGAEGRARPERPVPTGGVRGGTRTMGGHGRGSSASGLRAAHKPALRSDRRGAGSKRRAPGGPQNVATTRIGARRRERTPIGRSWRWRRARGGAVAKSQGRLLAWRRASRGGGKAPRIAPGAGVWRVPPRRGEGTGHRYPGPPPARSPPRARARDSQFHGTTPLPRRTAERVSRETKASRAGARGGGREPEESPESRSGAGLEQAWSERDPGGCSAGEGKRRRTPWDPREERPGRRRRPGGRSQGRPA